jgi:hypothetical protein
VPSLVNTLPAVLGAGGVTVNVPDVVMGPPVSVKPLVPAPLTLVTVPPAEAALIVTLPTPVPGLIVMLVPAIILSTVTPGVTDPAVVA